MEDRELELSEHLAELRTRLIRCVIYVSLGVVVTWILYDRIYGFVAGPVITILDQTGNKFMVTRIAEGFMLRCHISLITGIILTSPLITFEIWGFVTPALTKAEKQPIKWIAPLCVLLFAGGVAVGYSIIPTTMKFLISYVPPGAEARLTVADNLVFIVKMLLAFGIVFELPVILLFLGKLGLVNSKTLISGWRYAVVGIAILAAVITPSGDLFTMMSMAVPVTFLYAVSILMVRLVEEKPQPKEKK
ncbi:MAG TPA: twin-arginine translocase subunit TatC [Armatimonadota bacterium]|nr:twin-arginine translocase subunit TatC [Armatimonadota bacterium]HOP80301.1 twin-arginine translocase subunit TatC [Armatimonadota bacterium]HPP75771.1 twin-arginine translocase subunit TatC [Armatimonadota bacterium]